MVLYIFRNGTVLANTLFKRADLDEPDMEELYNRIGGKRQNVADEEFEQLEFCYY